MKAPNSSNAKHVQFAAPFSFVSTHSPNSVTFASVGGTGEQVSSTYTVTLPLGNGIKHYDGNVASTPA